MQLPDLEAAADRAIVAENLDAVQAIALAFELERMRLFEVVDRIVELFGNGALPIGRDVAGRIGRRRADVRDRLDAAARAELYASVLGVPGGTADGAPNREFAELWLRFLAAVAAHARRPGGARVPGLADDGHVRRAARDLAANASLHGGGMALFKARELAAQMDVMTEIVADPDVVGAFGAGDMWQVIDQVNAGTLGGAATVDRHRDRAHAIRVVFRWLVAHAAGSQSGALGQSGTPASPPRGDAELVAAAAQWLGPRGDAGDRSAWGRPWLRIDVGALVGKYVGETERNLEALFARAAHADAVLLLDEADALFGRRTDVADAHDRYANLDVSDLLRRLEDHAGAVVLAPDLRRRIDAACADERNLRIAFDEAAASYAEGGCPIGGVLVDNDSGAILGRGHNALVQEGNPIVHGEMAALRAAGRRANRHRTTMVTTLQPCFMCAGTIVQFGIPRVVIGDVVDAASDETIAFMRRKGVEVVVMNPDASRAARDCVELVRRFRVEKPELWLEDWGGGSNPELGAATS